MTVLYDLSYDLSRNTVVFCLFFRIERKGLDLVPDFCFHDNIVLHHTLVLNLTSQRE